jgi:hypothetical protein
MSRTDKTAPYRVKVFYYPKWVEEYHDHNHGLPCELPEKPTPQNLDQYDQFVLIDGEWVPYKSVPHAVRRSKPFRNTCHWTASHEYRCSGMARCGCAMCKGLNYETAPNKKTRMSSRKYVRGAWKLEY